MSLVIAFACALAAPQLSVRPFPATVGEAVTVRAERDGAPIAALSIGVELPDGRGEACGVTDAAGEVRYSPGLVGYHVFVGVVDGVRTMAPLSVEPRRAHWPLAFGSVPLGLALLWWNLARRRRGERD